MFSSSLYKSSPIPLQDALLSGRGWLRRRLREGRQFTSLLDEALSTQWLDAEAMAAYQTSELQRVLDHATATVPFYRARHAGTPRNTLPARQAAMRRPSGSLMASSARPMISSTSGKTRPQPQFSPAGESRTRSPQR